MIICVIKYLNVTVAERRGPNTGLAMSIYSLQLYLIINVYLP